MADDKPKQILSGESAPAIPGTSMEGDGTKKGRMRLNPRVKRKSSGVEVFKLKRSAEKSKEIAVIGTSVVMFILFMSLGVLGWETMEKDPTTGATLNRDYLVMNTSFKMWIGHADDLTQEPDENGTYPQKEVPKFFRAPNWVLLALIVLFLPIGLWYGKKASRINNLESRLADFLRDLSESAKAGVTLAETIRIASEGDYGDLTPEIKKMAYQISWGVNATDALQMFAERTNTPLVDRAVTLIIEATNAGGDISKVLEAAAADTKEIQLLQREREIQMFMYVAVIFVAFVVFLVVILIVYNTFVPQMEAMAEDFRAQEDSTQLSGGLDPTKTDFQEIKDLYLYAGLVQGIGDGMIAGIMGTGRYSDGAKYSAFMLLIVFIIFTFVF